MFWVIFQGSLPPHATALSESYYIQLQPLLQKIPGFISEVPFASTTDPEGQVLLASFIDEKAEHAWRVQHDHLRIQRTSKEKVFSGYRIRVGWGVGDGDDPGDGGGEDQQVVVLYQLPHEALKGKPPGEIKDLLDPETVSDVLTSDLNDSAIFQSEKTFLWLSSWKDDAAAVKFESSIIHKGGECQRVRVLRDYGKFDRKGMPGNENDRVPLAEGELGDESKDATGN